jgi:hypothetical protein
VDDRQRLREQIQTALLLAARLKAQDAPANARLIADLEAVAAERQRKLDELARSRSERFGNRA